MTAALRTKAEIEASDTKPEALAVNASCIPAELRERPQWVCWGYERREDKSGKWKWSKIPRDPKTGRMAKSTDPATWGTFEQAKQRRGGDGIGFVFAAGDPYCGVDLDDAIDPATGNLLPWAVKIIRDLDSYTEISPSQTGVKVFLRGKLPAGGNRKGHFELYDCGRYFAVTGARLQGYPETVNPRQEAIEQLHARIFGQQASKGPSSKPTGSNGHATLEDAEIIRKASEASNGAKFGALWAGDTTGNGGDDSAADLALCDMLAFWTGPNSGNRIDQLFRQSGLMREKWNRQDYRDRTIGKALAGRTEFYTGKPASRGPAGARGQAPSASDDYHLTDLGNARRLVAGHGQDLRHCHPSRRWYVWDGKRWAEDATAEVVRRVKETQGELYRWTAAQMANVGEIGEQQERKDRLEQLGKILKHSLAWEDSKRIAGCLELAKSEPGIPILPTEVDVNPFLLNVENGTLDLRTGELRDHRRADLITKLAPIKYLAEARCPLWECFLKRIMDDNQDLIGYLQRVVGYSLSGDVSEQCLWFLHGAGSNGKTTFLTTLLAILGDYGLQSVSELLLQRNHDAHPTERANLAGRRLVAIVEIDDGRRLAESFTKQLTGGEVVQARRMREDFWELKPTWKIFLAANHKPSVRGTDLAIWRRIKLIPFTVTIGDEEKDKHLCTKLQAEGPGILGWALRGCLEWQKYGLGEPDEVRQATAAYQAEQDTLAGFIAECCFTHPEARAKVSALLEAYQRWTGDKHTSPKGFVNRIRERGFDCRKWHGNAVFCFGLGLPDECEPDPVG